MVSEKVLSDVIREYFKNLIEQGLQDVEILKCNAELQELIQGLPKVGEWIPCGERLPECDWGFENQEGLLFQLESGTIEAGFYGTGGKYRNSYFRPYRSDSEGFDVKDVVAWMPLPEAYNVSHQNITVETSSPWKDSIMQRFTRGE